MENKLHEEYFGLIIRPNWEETIFLDKEQFYEHFEGILKETKDKAQRLKFIENVFENGNGQSETNLTLEILYKL